MKLFGCKTAPKSAPKWQKETPLVRRGLQFDLFLARPEGFEPPTLWFEVRFRVYLAVSGTP